MDVVVKVIGPNCREHIVVVPRSYKDSCRQLAFRLIYGRRENNYQEYGEVTEMLSVESMSEDVAKFLSRMV